TPPAHAVEDGTIAKLSKSKAGGLTVYQFDPADRLCFYYAHLERYADGLHDGQTVSRGELIGYVGTSGNAPPNTPHLHFGVFQLDADKHWWEGTAIDPYEVFHRQSPPAGGARRGVGASETTAARLVPRAQGAPPPGPVQANGREIKDPAPSTPLAPADFAADALIRISSAVVSKSWR